MTKASPAAERLRSRQQFPCIQALLLVLAISAWSLAEQASAQITVQLSATSSVPDGYAVVTFSLTGDGVADYFQGTIEYDSPDLVIQNVVWCIPEGNFTGSCTPGNPGFLQVNVTAEPGSTLDDFTGYVVFRVDENADFGGLQVAWGFVDAGISTVDPVDGEVSVQDPTSIVVSPDPTLVDFGTVEVDAGGALESVEICGTNDQGGSVWVIGIQADNEDFFIEPDAGSCPETFPFDLTDQPGGCCDKVVFFDPSGSALFESDMQIFASNGVSAVLLSGSGVPAGSNFLPTMSPPSRDFGEVPTNTPDFETFTVFNDGALSGEINDVFIDGDAEFSIIGGSCVVPVYPLELGPGEGCTIDIEFLVPGLLTDPASFSADLVVDTEVGNLVSSLVGTGLTVDEIFADLFETLFFPMPLGSITICSTVNWSGAVGLTDTDVGSQGAANRRYTSLCGLRVPLDGEPRYLDDQRPNPEAFYNARFYAFFDDVESGSVLIFEGDEAGSPRFQVIYEDGGLVFNVFDNDDTEFSETIPDIGTGWHSIEVVWESGPNAEVLISVNGGADVAVSVDNSDHRISELRLGNIVADLNGVGSVDFDAFDSRRITRPGRLLVGDADDDGQVDLFDLEAIDDEIADLTFAPGQPDCNEDGVIDVADRECVGEIVAAGQAITFALDQISAIPGSAVELSAFLDANPFDASTVFLELTIDTDLVAFGTGGVDCGRVVEGADLGAEHTLICEQFGVDSTGVAVLGTEPLPVGELFRVLLDVDPGAIDGAEAPVVIEQPEFFFNSIVLPLSMLDLGDGLLGVFIPVADLVLDPLQHDFGEIEPDGFPVTQDFTLTNDGDPDSVADIELVSLVGDTAFSLVGDGCSDNSLPQGQSCIISVQFDAANLVPGNYGAALQFIASPALDPAPISGTRAGIVDFDIVPENTNFGSVQAGANPVTRNLTLVNTGELPFDAADIDFGLGGDPVFSIIDNSCVAGLVLSPGESCLIVAAFDGGNQAPGSYVGFFQAISPSASVTVTLSGVRAPTPTLAVAPSMHDFGAPDLAEFPVQQLFVVSNSGEPGSVATVSLVSLSPSPYFSLQANTCPGNALAAGQACIFTVAFDASEAAPDDYTASVQVFSNAGNPAVALAGTRAIAGLELTLTPESLDFGDVEADQFPVFQTFTVQAAGEDDIAMPIDNVLLSGDPAYAIVSDDCSGSELANGDACQVEVSFDAADLAPGTYDAVLDIVSEQPLAATITGQFVVAPPTPNLFVLPEPAAQRPGVASFVGDGSATGTGRRVSPVGRIGPAATTRFLVSVPSEGAVYLVSDGAFNAPARVLSPALEQAIRFQLSEPSLFGISLAGDGDFFATGHATLALGDHISGRIVLLSGDDEIEPGPASIDLSELAGNGTAVGAGFSAVVVGGSALSGQAFELAFIGDFNGNGHDDLAIGLPDHGSAGQGRVYVLFGSSGLQDIDLDSLSPDQGIIIDGNVSGAGLGFSLAGAGDFNGSGLADLVIGAPFASDYGRVVLVFGSNEPASINISELDGSNGFIARMPVDSSAGPRFGYAVDGAGDFDGDGFADVIVGAPRLLGNGANAAPGQARILFGAADPGVSDVLVDDTEALRQLEIHPFNIGHNSMFGYSVAGLGDGSRNGFSDVAIGDPGFGDPANDPTQPRFTGRAYAVFGQSDPPSWLVTETLDASQAVVYRPQQPLALAGYAVAGAGDFSGDGFPDLLVTGLGGSTEQHSEAGQVWLVGGRETALDPNPVLESIEPGVGNAAGGQTVTLRGRHFLEGVEVWFGDQPCTDVVRIDHRELRCRTPATAASEVEVTVINPDGTSDDVALVFQFIEPTELVLEARAFPGQFGQAGRLAEFEVANMGGNLAAELVLVISVENGAILDWFSLAPQCTVSAQLAQCDFSALAPWQCSFSDEQAVCNLGTLPEGAQAAVMLDLGGADPVSVSLTLSSINSETIETDAELFGANP